MGLYLLNAGEHPPHGKAETLANEHGAKAILPPRRWEEIPADAYLIVVVDNGAWEAALVAYDERQFARVIPDRDDREKTWLLMDRETVARLEPLLAVREARKNG